MKSICLLILVFPFFVQAAALKTVITDVTLFADRARVTREAEPVLPEGISVLELEPLPAWVNPSSIRARVEGGEVLDVMSRREFLVQTPDGVLRERETMLQILNDEMKALHDKKAALESTRKQIGQISEFVSGTLPADALTRDIPVAYFREMVDYTHKALLEVGAELRNVAVEERKLQPKIHAMSQEIMELKKGNRLEQLYLNLQVKAPSAGPARLVLTYETPGATWEVTHDVRVEDGNRVRIVSLGVIRQTTGEDWENVNLSFSTHRPGNAARIPELESLLLGNRQAVNPQAFIAAGAMDGWAGANDYYLSNSIDFNISMSKGAKVSSARWSDNQRALLDSQNRSSAVFVALEERGTTALFRAEGRYTVRTDGNPVRVPYATVAREGNPMMMAAPEASPNAARTLDLIYTHSEPLLPGNAALFLDGAYIGNTQLTFTGPGEAFVLFAGTEDRLKLTRKLNHEKSELKRGRRSNQMRVYFDIVVENTGNEDLMLKLADRVPVSDERDIKVEDVRIDPRVDPDAAGLFFWETKVPARGEQRFSVSYRVEYPRDLKPRAPRQADLNAFSIEFDAAAPGQAADQILQLERSF